MSSSPRVAVVYYSLYGHIATLAKAVAEGAKAGGAQVDLFQVKETLSDEVRTKMHAPPLDTSVPVLEPNQLADYQGILFGFPTRYGRAVAQMSAMFDQTGGLWAKNALEGVFAGAFTSSGAQHGGQETTILSTVPFFAHHGMIYVTMGYIAKETFDNSEVTGGSPWGSSTIANDKAQGDRQVSAKELSIGRQQGEDFAKKVGYYVKGKAQVTSAATITPARELPPAIATTQPSVTNVGETPQKAGNAEHKGYTVDSTPAASTTPQPKASSTSQPPKPQKKGGFFASCCGKADNFDS